MALFPLLVYVLGLAAVLHTARDWRGATSSAQLLKCAAHFVNRVLTLGHLCALVLAILPVSHDVTLSDHTAGGQVPLTVESRIERGEQVSLLSRHVSARLVVADAAGDCCHFDEVLPGHE